MRHPRQRRPSQCAGSSQSDEECSWVPSAHHHHPHVLLPDWPVSAQSTGHSEEFKIERGRGVEHAGRRRAVVFPLLDTTSDLQLHEHAWSAESDHQLRYH